ncbi:MAG: hypothetical protein M0Q38_10855 [Bacteroidales bacterium]|jgi:hypothetical protein|nr:hypothetical protein [Bacteroidales bacterium]
MVERKRNSKSVVLVIFLMFFFFVFTQREKEKNIPGSTHFSIVVSEANISSVQAIITPGAVVPEISFYEINKGNEHFIFPDFNSYRELVVSKQLFNYFCLSQLKFLSKKPILGLNFLQKVPSQEKEDDILTVA